MKRRIFLQSAAAGLLAARSFPSIAQVASPNDKIQVGCIGVGGMGQSNMSDFLSHDDARVVAICDVDPAKRQEAAGKVKEKYGQGPDQYADFREVLARQDIDAVMIGTPDHWHCLLTALACQSGKDVYVEKPLAHNLKEGRMAVNAARKHDRITQMGTQVHQTQTYARGVEIVKSGVLGEIHKVRVWIAANEAPGGLGKPEDGPPPEGVDYNTWLGPAPERPFNPNRFHFKWRFFWDYGGGSLADMACHIVDPVYWALGFDSPKTVTGVGGRHVLKDNAETFDTQEVVWTYDPPAGQESPVQLIWSLTGGNPHGLEKRGKGILFCGTEGSLLLDYGTYELYNKADELVEESSIQDDSLGKAGKNHKREFLDGIRARKRCSCDIEYGYKVTTVPLTGNIACRVGRTLQWDASTETFGDDSEANALLTRDYRDGFSPKDLGIEV